MNSFLEKLCKMTEAELKEFLTFKLLNTHNDITTADGFVFAKGEFPVLLVAHLDTVHQTTPTEFIYEENQSVVSSPSGIGGDDRCGVYAILQIINKVNCSVLFTEGEECGLVGAKKFINHDIINTLNFNYIIELDRKGENQAVFYNLENLEFEKFITKEYFVKDVGSSTDIRVIAPFLNVSAVNLSCGYYLAHTNNEFIDLDALENSILEVIKLLNRTDIIKDKFTFTV